MTASVPATFARPCVEVTVVTDDVADAVAAFMRRVWAGPVTGDRVRRALREAARLNPAVPGAMVPAAVYLKDGEAVGYLGTIPAKFWDGRSETPAHWMKGFMVLPEHQNGPVGFAVLKELLRHVEVSGTLTVALPARRLFQAVGFVDCGSLPNYVALLRPGRVAATVDPAAIGIRLPVWTQKLALFARRSGMARVAGGSVGAGIRAWTATRGSSRGFSIGHPGALPAAAEMDDLWVRSRASIRAGAVRNAAFLTWRYQCSPGGLYEAATVRERGGDRRLMGIAIVRRVTDNPDPRLRGLKVATLADVLFPVDSSAGVAVVAAAEQIARRMGADALICSTAHPAITSALARRAHIRLSGNVHLMVRDPGRSTVLSTDVREWWMMRGDANSDDAF